MWSSIVLSFTSPGLQRPLHHLGTAWIAKHGSFLVVPCELLLSGSTKLLDQVDERFPLDRRQAVGRALHRPLVKSKEFPDPRGRPSVSAKRTGCAGPPPRRFERRGPELRAD